MSKATPGPWIKDDGCESAKSIGSVVYQVWDEAEQKLICSITGNAKEEEQKRGFLSPAEAKANARLIAAAPELLELLSIMFDAYENGVPCYEDPEEEYHYLGNAFKLKDEHFHRIADLLNKLDPREEPAKATGGK